jgi:hypothetical protein
VLRYTTRYRRESVSGEPSERRPPAPAPTHMPARVSKQGSSLGFVRYTPQARAPIAIAPTHGVARHIEQQAHGININTTISSIASGSCDTLFVSPPPLATTPAPIAEDDNDPTWIPESGYNFSPDEPITVQPRFIRRRNRRIKRTYQVCALS